MRTLQVMGVVASMAPLAFVLGLGVLLEMVLRPALPLPGALTVAGVVAALGIFAFTWAIFSLLQDMQAQLERRAEEWRSLFELGQEVTASPDLEGLLSSVVERAQHLLQADVAALLLLEPSGEEMRLAAHRGLGPEPSLATISLPVEGGPQALVVKSKLPLVVPDCRRRPDLDGPIPLGQEKLMSVVAVPFSAKGHLLGVLMVGNRHPYPFRDNQAQLLSAFANWAAVAVETSRLYDRMRSLALLEERERIAMDLHDGVIQSLYAVTLGLEAITEELGQGQTGPKAALERSIDDLGRVIRDLRHYIYDLRPAVVSVGDLRRALAELVEEAKSATGIDVRLETEGILPPLKDEQALGIYHVAQEAISNVIKHARASRLTVRLAYHRPTLILEVADDGIGFNPEEPRERIKQGLRNMSDRARALAACLSIRSAPSQGTLVRLEVPVEEAVPWQRSL